MVYRNLLASIPYFHLLSERYKTLHVNPDDDWILMIGHSSEKCNSLLGEARRSAAHYSYQLSKVSLLKVPPVHVRWRFERCCSREPYIQHVE